MSGKTTGIILTADASCAILKDMITEAEVLKQALELPVSQRCAIAQKLLESLEPADATHKEIEGAWAVEIEKRAVAYDRGETQSIDGREAINRIRQSVQRDARS